MLFKEYLKTKIIVSDGAMGTMLQANGLLPGQCPEEWNISHAEKLKKIHQDYFNAGADIVETNTFGGNYYRLKHYGLEQQSYEFNKTGAEIAKQVCPKGKFVAGSVGPTGEFIEPFGTLKLSDFEFGFKDQIKGLIDGKIDVLFVETMSSLDEIKAAVNIAQKINKNIPIVASMSFEKSNTGHKTLIGVSISEFIDVSKDLPLIAIGANCGKGSDEMIDIMEEFRQLTDMPLIAQANAGLPETNGDKIIYRETLQQRKDLTRVLISEKVNIIGGCCGTTPDHIHALSETVQYYKSYN